MNKKYTIEWLEVFKEGESNGRPWKITKATFKDEEGHETTDVSTFEPITLGQVIKGAITKNEKYSNWEFKKAMEKPNFMKKGANIEKAMEKKEQSITKFQDNKEWSIKISSTMRDAVLLSIAENNPTPERIQKWRKWLLDNWDVEPSDISPF